MPKRRVTHANYYPRLLVNVLREVKDAVVDGTNGKTIGTILQLSQQLSVNLNKNVERSPHLDPEG